MFTSAALKLTGLYLAIILAICLFFSLALYQQSTNDLQTSLDHQAQMIARQPGFRSVISDAELVRLQQEQLELGNERILRRLIYVNVIILLLGGVGSYFLARRTLKPIQDALDSQSRFSADASHELRTPLTAMQTEIEVALRDKELDSAEARRLLRSNLEEVAKLKALSNGLLTLSRHQSGADIELQPTSVMTAIEEARRRLERTINRTKADVQVSGRDYEIPGHPESLTELMSILIDNAIKYSRDRPEISIRVSASPRSVHIQVSDRGIGMKASDIPYIFNRFFRADTSRSKTTKGYGLGLSIAKQIVDLHHGSIEATSKQDQGSSFLVKLPLRQFPQVLPS